MKKFFAAVGVLGTGACVGFVLGVFGNDLVHKREASSAQFERKVTKLEASLLNYLEDAWTDLSLTQDDYVNHINELSKLIALERM